MRKWMVEFSIGALVLGVVLPILYMLDGKYLALQDHQSRVEPAVLEACMDVASTAGTRHGTVKDRCLQRFDKEYAQLRRADTQR